ncbi:MAG: hypothetical protein QNJ02_09610 [Desulfobacterales bacterium]|nr:hypothetical protein [Desulfobacterales bacterium]MDJ0875517.1 hypothetical protein [Desulfobacterales bacterium]
MAPKIPQERAIANLLFWCLVVPIVAGVFLRLFFVLFNFGYGFVVFLIFGQAYAGLVAAVALLTALGFTVGVLVWVYSQYQKHILATF